jgi:hypothetical protein
VHKREEGYEGCTKGDHEMAPFMSSFVLMKMCALMKSSIRTDKGFKEVHLTAMDNVVLEQCDPGLAQLRCCYHQILAKSALQEIC